MKIMHIDTTDYSNVKKNEIAKVTGKWIQLKTAILGEVN